MPTLPKDHAFMDRPYSGKAILFDMLRTEKTVKIRDYEKKLKAAGRTITALPRILYWVGKAVEEYGYDLVTDSKGDEVYSVSLEKRADGPVKPSKKAKSSKKTKPSKKAKPSKKEEKPAKKTSKKSSKKAKPSSKKSKKDESESESESKESESESAAESESDESEA